MQSFLLVSGHHPVIAAGIHARLSCLAPLGLMQICSRQICAAIQNTGMQCLSSLTLDARIPTGMT